jgi:hypothetical protein
MVLILMTQKNVALYYYVEVLFKDIFINTLNKKFKTF